MAVHRNNQACKRDVRCRAENRDRLADGCSCGGHIFHNEDAVAIFQRTTNEYAAFAVILRFLAVEAELHIASAFGKRHRHGHYQWDAFVCRAKQAVEPFRERSFNGVGVGAAECCQLRAGSILSSVHKVRGLAPALGGEVAESQNADIKHEINETALVVLHGA